MKKIFLILPLLLSLSSAAKEQVENTAITPEQVQRAADVNINHLLDEIKRLKAEKHEPTLDFSLQALFAIEPLHERDCNDDKYNCSTQCKSRYSDGTCSSYGPDFCGYGAKCVVHCKSRYSDGTCSSYGPDFCGPKANCAHHCKSRYSDGSCSSHAPDFCGPKANCVVNCKSRYSDGSCSSYGPDICY